MLKTAMTLIIEENPLPEEVYRAHKFEPAKDYLDCWGCHINGRNSDWLLIYKYYHSDDLVVFIRTGTHADVF